MSRDSSEDFGKLVREEALRNFEFHDPDTLPLNVSEAVAINALRPTSAIIVTGFLPFYSIRFSINLLCQSSGNIALHFNPRIDRGYVVRNSKLRGHWDDEETCSPAGPKGTVFRRNAYFHVIIFCTETEFQISINEEHFCEFAYRVALREINGIEVNGDVEDVRFRQTTFQIYPKSKLTPYLQLNDKQSLEENLKVPVTVDITSDVRNGVHFTIKGRLKLLPHSFYVNLQKGKAIYPHPEIALHVNPRFLYGTSPPCMVMNCWTNGAWSHEERHQGNLFWLPGRDFFLVIRCEYQAFTIWLNNKMIGEFKHRLDPSIVDTLRIYGDVHLYQLAIGTS
ncbi:galectin-8 isoform X1 [Cephus cinctus]|uniref:Galectin n=1 Tax=Cephus cinctus TaxID=211228 RepID=A0AAJ7C3R9_CEPCN|nr:galectin-8 isoform X1 [Cephus cinctus]